MTERPPQTYLPPAELAQVTSHNTSFSPDIPGLQLAWDSTSMGALKECPYKYYLSVVLGFTPRAQSVHLTFGLWYHAALERYDHKRAEGLDHQESLRFAVAWLMEVSWERSLGRPWLSDHPAKNRFTLVRSVVWYLDQFQDDNLKTVLLASGKPAVELSFRLELDHSSSTLGTPFVLCGHLDKLVEMEGPTEPGFYISDKKTSSSTISQDFFSKFSPDNQMSTYAFAGKVVYSVPIRGIIIDAAQIAVSFTRFARGLVERPAAVLDEWYEDLGMWLGMAELYALRNRWPRNEKSCNAYGGCAFRGICSKSPSVRAQWLKVDYAKRTWDPLVVRGDI